MKRPMIARWAAAATAFTALVAVAIPATPGAAAPAVTPADGALSDLIPRPVSAEIGDGQAFELTEDSRIRARGAARDVADNLERILAPATGYDLRANGGRARDGDIVLAIDDDAEGGPESYELSVSSTITITAPSTHGLFNGVQTLRHLMPSWIESSQPVQADWTVPALTIADEPRFEYRGVMLDLSRAFLTVEQVEHVIDQMAALKLNRLHLHLSDDPGWRIAIDQPDDSALEYEDLTRYGSRGGNLSNVGGTDRFYYTRAEYRDLVAYAQERFITVVPEIDGPAHATSALASLAGLNASGERAPVFVPTDGARTYFDPNVAALQGFLSTVFAQLASDGNGEYLHLGGDEAHGMSSADYDRYLDQARSAITAAGKTPIMWNEAAPYAGEGDVVQYWLGSMEPVRQAADRGAQVIMSPAAHAYLDQAYPDGSPHDIGAPSYACGGSCDWRNAYAWDPVMGGLTESQVLGVESTVWGYSHDTQDYLLNPRLAANAEVAWSPAEDKDTEEFGSRLAHQSVRYALNDVNFHTSTSIDWSTGAMPTRVCSTDLDVTGETFGLAVAEQYQPKMSVAWIDYGDGTGLVPAAMRTPYEQTGARTHGLMTVLADHEYARSGTYEAELVFQATSSGARERHAFTVSVGDSCEQRTNAHISVSPHGRLRSGDEATVTVRDLPSNLPAEVRVGDGTSVLLRGDEDGEATITITVP